MLRFLKRLFTSKTNKSSFPKISLGFRGEDLLYETETESLYVGSTWINGRRVYLDGIREWRSKRIIPDADKGIIFENILDFLNNEGNERPIMVINTDHDKDLWETLCEQYKDRISSIEYESDNEKDDFFFHQILDSIRRGGSLVEGGRTISTEEELLDYWVNRRRSKRYDKSNDSD